MRNYIGLIHKESDFGVSFPDLPGVITAGKSLDACERLLLERFCNRRVRYRPVHAAAIGC
jgi:hypothetical protein